MKTCYSEQQARIASFSSASAPTKKWADVAIITLSFWLAYLLRGLDNTEIYLPAWLVSLPLYILIHEEITKRHQANIRENFHEVRQALAAWGLTLIGLLFISWTAKITADFSRIAIGTWTLLGGFGLAGWRLMWRTTTLLDRTSPDNALAVIAGDDKRMRQFVRHFQSSRTFKPVLLGYFAETEPNNRKETSNDPDIPFLGNLKSLIHGARKGDFSSIFVVMRPESENAQRRLITALCDTPASVYVVPSTHTEELAYAQWINYCGLPIVSIFETPYKGFNSLTKRVEDVLLAMSMLLVMAIPMLVIAAIIKLTSPGPAVFRQQRLGIDGREIGVLKFRTMTVIESGTSITQAVRDDPRITAIGTFLRRTSLDELPQIFNVLCGDMSVVGPRPHAVSVNQEYRKLIPGYMLRQRVRPGITGWAQIHGLRGSDSPENMENRVRYDLWYLTRWSLWLDLWIVIRTIPVFAGHRNAF
ncbi:MAG: undecaprenyl-phosphate glucose phosphotransferase [Gammaproteobacteria bacterium]|nr:undecaprenyl-phosphate glucose phosphotransferase [Gammaproteobacteria bacterium]